MNPELIYQIGGALIAAGAVYGGIRSDLKAMHEKIAGANKLAEMAQNAASAAHKRIDSHLENK